MTLIVEDGTGLATAESYASVAQATAYHTARGTEAWLDIGDVDREKALRRATDYMGQLYRDRWDGYRFTSIQRLDWPRFMVRDRNQLASFQGPGGLGVVYYPQGVIPAALIEACCAMGARAALGDLAPDQERLVQSETIGSISVTYQTGSAQATKFRAIDLMLNQFFRSSGSAFTLTRS